MLASSRSSNSMNKVAATNLNDDSDSDVETEEEKSLNTILQKLKSSNGKLNEFLVVLCQNLTF